MKVEPVVLENAFVRLEPVDEVHREGLRAAAKGDAALFDYMPMDLSGEGFDRWFNADLNRPTELGAMQGYGPVLMAGAEVIRMLRSFEVDRRLNTFHYRAPKS